MGAYSRGAFSEVGAYSRGAYSEVGAYSRINAIFGSLSRIFLHETKKISSMLIQSVAIFS